MADIEVKQKEAKTITFTITSGGTVVDLTGAILTFWVKKSKDDTTATISKVDADFGRAQEAVGIVTVAISEAELDIAIGNYVAELKTQFSASNIDKSSDLTMKVERAIITT